MGLVAGVQLSANNMLKVGDWIEMPSRGIDGVVIGVSLTTIKIRSWNNTHQTIPPYLLISEPFYNWQAMRDSGGRRIKRNINIDMSSVRFADDALLERLKSHKATASYMAAIKTTTDEGDTLTNIDLFIRVVNKYIDTHPRINHTMLAMVRQLQPTEWGLPIELYCFSADVNWVPYEHLQTEIISYVVALAPLFDIDIYQAPASRNFSLLR
jgi:miniconductance mechanosensitive channel